VEILNGKRFEQNNFRDIVQQGKKGDEQRVPRCPITSIDENGL